MYLELVWNISSGWLKVVFLFSTDNNGTVEHFSPDEHVKKVDEGKLDESSEDGHEAHDDKDVKGSRICNLNILGLGGVKIPILFGNDLPMND